MTWNELRHLYRFGRFPGSCSVCPICSLFRGVVCETCCFLCC